jgi:hypothetical protein
MGVDEMKTVKLYSGPMPRIHEPTDRDISIDLKDGGLRFGKKKQILKSTWLLEVRLLEKPTRYHPAGWAYLVGQLHNTFFPINCIQADGYGFETKSEAVTKMYEARDKVHALAEAKLARYRKDGLV